MAVSPLLTSTTLLSSVGLFTSDGSDPASYASFLTSTTKVTGTSVVSSQGNQVVLGVEVAFDADNTASVYVNDGTRVTLQPATWISVSEYVRNANVQRGRQAELNQFEAGSATITLDDRAGIFHPANPAPLMPSRGWPTAPGGGSWPYSLSGNVTPMRRVRVYADWNGTRYPLFQGFAESWTPSYPAAGKDEVVTLRCTDAFKALRYALVGAPGTGQVTMTSQYPGDRITALMSYVSGIATRIMATGTEVIRQVTYSGAELISAVQDAAAAGLGYVYCDTDGAVRYDNRTYRLQNENTVRAVFGENISNGEIPVNDAVLAFDDTLVYTEVTITPSGSGSTDQPQTAKDDTAQKKYGRRVYSLSVPLQKAIGGSAPATDPDTTLAASYAAYLLSRYKQPGVRFQSLTIDPQAYPQMAYPAALGIPLGGLIRVKRRNMWDTSNPTDKFVYVENITHDVQPGRWQTKFELSASDVQAYWVLGYPGFSELEATTKLSY